MGSLDASKQGHHVDFFYGRARRLPMLGDINTYRTCSNPRRMDCVLRPSVHLSLCQRSNSQGVASSNPSRGFAHDRVRQLMGLRSLTQAHCCKTQIYLRITKWYVTWSVAGVSVVRDVKFNKSNNHQIRSECQKKSTKTKSWSGSPAQPRRPSPT